MGEPITCKNCGNSFIGKFCNRCGEKAYTLQDKKLSHIFGEVFHFITHFEGTFITTVKVFFTKPGKLSADYCFGIRKKYFKPISFFLLMVILYLLFPRFEGLNMKLGSYLNSDYGFEWIAAPVLKSKMKNQQATFTEIANRYNKKSPQFSKLGLLLMIPLTAIVLVVLFINHKKHFFDHFILSTEINSFYIFSHFLFLPFWAMVVEKTIPAYNYIFDDGNWTWWIMIALFAIFTIRALKTFYKERWWLILIKGLIFLFIFAAYIRYVYSILLFLLVMLSI